MIPDFHNAEEVDDFGEFVFDFEKQDMMTSASDHGDDIEDKLFNMTPGDQFASDTGLFAQMHVAAAPLPLRPYRSFAKTGDRASPTISGNELRTIEGRKPSPEAQMSSLAMSSSATAAAAASAPPALRRKNRFGQGTSNAPRYNVNHQLSRMPPPPDGQINEGHGGELHSPDLPLSPMSPSSFELTQKFREQISLQSNRQDPPQMQTFIDDIERENLSPRDLFQQHRKTFSEQSAIGSSYSHLIDYSQQSISHSIPRDVSVPIPIISTQQASQNSDTSSQRLAHPSNVPNDNAFRHHRHAQSWAHGPLANGFTSEYTVSPNEIHQDWVPDIPDEPSTYFPHMTAYPTPTSQGPTGMFGPDDLNPDCYAPSDLPLHHHSSFPNLHANQDVLLNQLANRRPHTPPPSNPSASPPTPEVTPSPQKQSKASSRRQGNPKSLRLRKSAAVLKPAKSLPALKSPKSAGHLRGKKSIGGSGSGGATGLNNSHHHHSQQNKRVSTKSPIKKEKSQSSGTNFGFRNLTAYDSQEILTGVAPSGSSKTKARRELEANEERRRLIKSIEVNGGDVEGLKRELNVPIEA